MHDAPAGLCATIGPVVFRHESVTLIGAVAPNFTDETLNCQVSRRTPRWAMPGAAMHADQRKATGSVAHFGVLREDRPERWIVNI